MMLRVLPVFLVLILVSLLFNTSSVCALQKLRIWAGPDDFVEGIPPEPRSGHRCALSNRRLFVFGGMQIRTGLTQSFFQFDTTFLAWTNLSTSDTPSPPALADFGMASSDDAIYIFGGYGITHGRALIAISC